jgi:hypothetical protein
VVFSFEGEEGTKSMALSIDRPLICSEAMFDRKLMAPIVRAICEAMFDRAFGPESGR